MTNETRQWRLVLCRQCNLVGKTWVPRFSFKQIDENGCMEKSSEMSVYHGEPTEHEVFCSRKYDMSAFTLQTHPKLPGSFLKVL